MHTVGDEKVSDLHVPYHPLRRQTSLLTRLRDRESDSDITATHDHSSLYSSTQYTP